MIKLAAMTSVCPDWELEKIVDKMLQYGYQGLEPRIGWGHAAGIEADMPPARRQAVRAVCDRAKLRLCCIATGARMALADPGALEKSLAEARAAIDLAADLGAPFVRTFGGPRGNGNLHAIVRRTAEAYAQLTAQAADRGVTLLMETHDEWCVSAQVRAVVEAVDHPNLGVLWDIMHPQRFLEPPGDTMRTIGRLTRHLHAHDGRYESRDAESRITTVPLGEGFIDHATPVRLLHAAGYDGYFSVEVIHRPGSVHDADGTLRQYAQAFGGITKNLPS